MILDEIVARTRRDVAERQTCTALEGVRKRAEKAGPRRSLRRALDVSGVSLIAEIKRASPSAGAFVEHMDPAEWAKGFAANGASAISVLTNQPFFHGTLADLRAARAACSIPVLQKDFLLGPYQIYEGAAAGADAVLLIVGLAPEQQLKRDLDLAHALGMEALVEVHTEDDIEQAVVAGAKIVGVNNRDLRSFRTDLAVTERLCRLIPDDICVVSESGVRTPADIRRLAASGVSGVLVGESIMTAKDPWAHVRSLVEAGS
ncbi:MAG: indole-3-glycerol phosphate synthase TrpC [Actinobacteria bacterium]|nr:indole-3-glycerol phosphate synthase TrpC [Actinomycetota bacterium]